MAASAYFDQIQQIYLAYLGRPADPDGLDYWASQVDAEGGSLAGVIGGFSASAESSALYGQLTTDQVITAIYVNLFNRQPDAAGLAYWKQQLDGGEVPQAQAAQAILLGALTSDVTSVANKLTVAKAFTAQVDTSTELSGYGGSASLDYARSFLKTVGADAASLQAATISLSTAVAIATGTQTTPSGQTFTLTAGVDTISGTASADTIRSTLNGAFSSGDSINGGGGNDTLLVTGASQIVTSGITVTNVETASLTTGGTLTVDTTTWTGLTQLTTSSQGYATVTAGSSTVINATVENMANTSLTFQGGSDVTVNARGSSGAQISIGNVIAPTGAVDVTHIATDAITMGTISVAGGTTVHVTQGAENAVNTTARLGSVYVQGSADTTSVIVDNAAAVTATALVAGITKADVRISDDSYGANTPGTITNITINNYTSASINDNALTNLTLKGGSGNIIIDNSGLNTPTNTTLNLSINGLTGGTLDDADIYQTLNITTTGTASTLANNTFGGLQTLTLNGTQVLTLNSTAGLSAIEDVTVSGAAGLTASFNSSTLSTIDASSTSGNMTIGINGTTGPIDYKGGSGVDTLTIASVSGTFSTGVGNDIINVGAINGPLTIDVGTGTDRINLTAASTSATVFAKVTGLGNGDIISFAGALGGAAAASTQTSLSGPVTTQASLQEYLDAATAGDGSANTVLSWFQFGTNTYIVQDTSASTTFSAGHDSVIELTGQQTLTGASIASGVVTLPTLPA
ncbi:DUF4214 domain-containing protein [Pseudomonas triticifolii]|uniref:DUF4214 domain-containing protein n=1 Tax=Pseudomonas triticifolii TaxID=2762592 RepID=A0ABR7BHK6_9PSED|nr:DUF4214 domain-containing protein [Pseudomonas triticifolii]MBC3956390.1 DUF4214 domain-containing protein [Pseudomonas triticifolii]